MLVRGKEAGGNGGIPFNIRSDRFPVKQLDLWHGDSIGDATAHTVLKGIEVLFANGPHSNVGQTPGVAQPGIEYSRFNFQNDGDEQLSHMEIYGGKRADSLRLITKDGISFHAGGTGGELVTQPAAGKRLFGFYGRSMDDIHQLGAVFDD